MFSSARAKAIARYYILGRAKAIAKKSVIVL